MVKISKNPYKQKNPEEPEHLFSEKGNMEVIALSLDSVFKVSSLRILLPTDLTKPEAKKQVQNVLKAVIYNFVIIIY